MKCTELVIQDHAIIRRGLDVIDGMLKRLEGGERIETVDATVALKFLRVFVDQYHQVSEETVLFPPLLLDAGDDNSLQQLMSEHRGVRQLIEEIEQSLTLKRGMMFFCSARELTSVLRNHCGIEERVVSDLAARYLSKEQDDAIAAEFIANRAHVESYADLSRLERKYLPVSLTGREDRPSIESMELARSILARSASAR